MEKKQYDVNDPSTWSITSRKTYHFIAENIIPQIFFNCGYSQEPEQFQKLLDQFNKAFIKDNPRFLEHMFKNSVETAIKKEGLKRDKAEVQREAEVEQSLNEAEELEHREANANKWRY